MTDRNRTSGIAPVGGDPVVARAVRQLRNDVEELSPKQAADLKTTAGAFPLKPSRITWRTADSSRYVVDSVIAGVETTNATATTLASYVLATQRAAKFVAVIVARSGAGNVFTTELTAAYKRGTSTTLTAVGSATSGITMSDSGASTWTAAFDTLTAESRVRLRVTGAASTRVYWTAELRVQEVR